MKCSSQLRPTRGSSGNAAWHRYTTDTRLSEGLKHQGQGTLRAPQVDTCSVDRTTPPVLPPQPLSCNQHQCPRGEAVMSVGEGGKGPGCGRGSCHGDGFSGNQVKTTRGGGQGGFDSEIRTNHSPYLSLGINHHTNTCGHLLCAVPCL